MGVGKETVVIVIDAGAEMVPEYACDAVTPFASVAVTVNEYAPEVVGVPVIVPDVALSDRLAGSAPAVAAKAIGAVPPEVAIVWL